MDKNRDQSQTFLESFGFRANGVMHLNVTAIEPELTAELKEKLFFALQITTIDSEYEQTKEVHNLFCRDGKFVEAGQFEQLKWNDILTQEGYTREITANKEGQYNLFFINCFTDGTKISFKMTLEQYNMDGRQKNYLPAGMSPLPTVYAVFSGAYFIMFFVWVFGYMRGQGGILNKVHYLMSILVVLKFLSTLLYAMDQHTIKIKGTQDGWAVAYYVFAVLKTAFFFVIVTLIGTGWTFFKPFLSDKDKKIIMVVIPLQVLDNIAMVIINTHDPGYIGYIAWKDIFRLVDIICCGAILIPIIWSIKHLREASQSDGKAARNLQKLRLFRQFYLIVVSYIYFTRIIVYLLDAALPFKLLFLGDVFTEAATLSFFVLVGYKFRPMPANPYFNVEEEDAVRLEEMRAAEEE